MTKFDYDVLVLGSGPAGESAALNAMKHGHRVAVVEAQDAVGGACTHQGVLGILPPNTAKASEAPMFTGL